MLRRIRIGSPLARLLLLALLGLGMPRAALATAHDPGLNTDSLGGNLYADLIATVLESGNGAGLSRDEIFRVFGPVPGGASFGLASKLLDFNDGAMGGGPGMIAAGGTWNFSFWYRDPDGQPQTWNFSDALEIAFTP